MRNTGRTISRFPTIPIQTTGSTLASYYDSYGLRDAPDRTRLLRHRQLGPHHLAQGAVFRGAVLSLQSVQLRLASTDYPVATTWHQTSNYAGGQADAHVDAGPNSFSGGLYSFYQGENDLFGLSINDQSYVANSVPNTTSHAECRPGRVLHGRPSARGPVHYAARRRCAFRSFAAVINESATYPRIGATVEIPRLHWVLRGFYGHFFQPAPVETVSSSVPRTMRRTTPAKIPLCRSLGARRRASVRHSDPVQGLDAGRRYVQESRQQLPRSLQRRRVQHLLPHRRRWGPGARLGDDPALAAAGAFRPVPPEPTRTRSPSSGATSSAASPAASPRTRPATSAPTTSRWIMISATRSTPGSPRPCPHTWFSTNVYYGSGFTNGLAGSGEGPTRAIIFLCTPPSMCRRDTARRTPQALRQRDQCHQPPRAAGQLHHDWRFSLQRPANDLCGAALPFPLLRTCWKRRHSRWEHRKALYSLPTSERISWYETIPAALLLPCPRRWS